MSESLFTTRLQQLQKTLSSSKALLLSHPSDVHYFSGFGFLVPEEREALLIVTKNTAYLIHTSFSPLPQNTLLTFLTRCHPTFLKKHFQHIMQESPFSELFLDHESLFVSEYLPLTTISGITLKELDKNLIWEQRSKKDSLETTAIREACKLAVEAFKTTQKKLSIGITEQEFANLLEETMRKLGSQKPAFPTIVAFGENTAVPHHQPTTKKLENNTAVLVDFGATARGYRSDMTRAFWFGENPHPDFLKIENAVKTAYQKTIATLNNAFPAKELTLTPPEKPHTSHSGEAPKNSHLIAKDLDDTARTALTEAGYGKYFTHTTGHGLGLEIHEQPSISWSNEQKLVPGMIITIEPGVYLSGKFGYRYENTVQIL